ncbi:unnamed protein product [Ranitomeya imitator]|uniref:glutathione transferase n=1 Tax=Ranitomeya imitator TaxID=111125 RepID=A0ABN9L379_9NEOB|nr:unnamed protein product [Ranitomeya imitator]
MKLQADPTSVEMPQDKEVMLHRSKGFTGYIPNFWKQELSSVGPKTRLAPLTDPSPIVLQKCFVSSVVSGLKIPTSHPKHCATKALRLKFGSLKSVGSYLGPSTINSPSKSSPTLSPRPPPPLQPIHGRTDWIELLEIGLVAEVGQSILRVRKARLPCARVNYGGNRLIFKIILRPAGKEGVNERRGNTAHQTGQKARQIQTEHRPMSAKPKLHYLNGRGKMESIRWLLAAAGVEFEEEFLETREQYEAMLRDGALMFQQVPMVEIDGMKLVQTNAILQYIASKIDMYVGGTNDLMESMMRYPFFQPELKAGHLNNILQKAKTRYFPSYEKVLRDHGGNYLVGNQFTWADGFKARISEIPTIKAFLKPGSQRKPVPDKKYEQTVRTVLQMHHFMSS